jgi:glycosyltransferase involved in cell wall biosynthesis
MERSRRLASVIVNNFNYARFLGDAIASALAQTYTPCEVIVVDDGSTDESKAVIESFGARVVTVLKENGGQASALNAGFAASRGEVILFLDADDMLLPSAVERAVECFSEGVVKVHWPLFEIDAEGARTGGVQPQRTLGEGNLRAVTISDGPLAGNSPPTSGNAWSRAFLDEVMPIPESDFSINADGYLLTLAWIYGEVRAIPDALSLYRVHGSNRFASRSGEERKRRHREKFVHQCDALERHLRSMGVVPRADIWRIRKGVYDERVAADARAEIAAFIPSGARYILVDENAFADAGAGGLADRPAAIPFLERNGEYWGRPDDDAMALHELERLRADGAQFVVFIWFTFWWLEHYRTFGSHLRSTYPCLLSNDRFVAFDLRT